MISLPGRRRLYLALQPMSKAGIAWTSLPSLPSQLWRGTRFGRTRLAEASAKAGGGEGGIATPFTETLQNKAFFARPSTSCVPVLCPKVEPYGLVTVTH